MSSAPGFSALHGGAGLCLDEGGPGAALLPCIADAGHSGDHVDQTGDPWRNPGAPAGPPPRIIGPHDEGTSYCTGLPEHDDRHHPHRADTAPWRCPECSTLLRYSHLSWCSQAVQA